MRVLRHILVCALSLFPLAAAAQDWKAEWDKTVAAANQEGALLFYSQPNQAAQDFILEEFPKAFPKITVSLSAIGSPEFVARIRTERSAGKYLWDVALAGPPGGYSLAHDGILDPVLPEFIDPALKNPDLWGGWHNAFTDAQGRYVFAMSKYIVGPWYDANHVPPAKFDKLGLKELLDPALTGKIAWHDPAVVGGGQSYAWLLRMNLGDDGLRKLVVDQRIAFYQQQFQVVEAMARGTAWVGIGPPVRSLIAPYTQAGVKTDVRNIGPRPDESLESMGGSGLYVFKNRPHPNATKVFINWLLSRDVQYRLAEALDQASRRQDLPPTTAPDETPIKDAAYLEPQREENQPAVAAAITLVNEDKKLR